MAVKLVEVDIAEPIPGIPGAPGYSSIQVLVRDSGAPVGRVYLEAHEDGISPDRLAAEISNWCSTDLLRSSVYQMLAGDSAETQSQEPLPFISVLVCTRDRPESLIHALRSLQALDYPNFEVLVIDNCPTQSETEKLAVQYSFRYVIESRPGLDWARNRGITEAAGDVIAFIDDDGAADPQWLWGLARGFADPGTRCITGLVLPLELETRAQELFEIAYGGFGRGFRQKVFRAGTLWKDALRRPSIGTGCNMAFRKSVFNEIGLFDPAFDVGTPTGGCGDLDMFHRLMRKGLTIEYRPEVVVYHRHRESMEDLRKQLRNYGRSFMAFQTKCFIYEPDERPAILRFVLKWYLTWCLKRIVRRLLSRRREHMPLRLILAEALGSLGGTGAYFRAVKQARDIAAAHAPIDRCTVRA